MKVYIDTSVIGGCFDREFSEWSNALFEEFISLNKKLMLSDLTLQELEFAPAKVKEKLNEIPDENVIPIEITDEAIK